MKIIGVVSEVPYSIVSRKNPQIVSDQFKQKTLLTPQKNKSSACKYIYDRQEVIVSLDDVEIKHKSTHASKYRDLDKIVWVGSMLTDHLSDEIEKNIFTSLQSNYKTNGFFPIKYEERGTLFAERIRNLMFSTHWSDVINEYDDDLLYKDYIYLNELMADEVMKVYKYGDVVWIPDEQFLILPAFLRKKVPDMKIAVTLQKFPDSDQFSCCAEPEHLLSSLLQASYIEFQCKNCLNNFVNYSKMMLDCSFDGKVLTYKVETKLKVSKYIPLPDLPLKFAATDKCISYFKKLKETYKDKKVIVSVTTLNTSHNIIDLYKAVDSILGDEYLLVSLEINEGSYNPEVKAEIGRIEDYFSARNQTGNFIRMCNLPDYIYYAWLKIADLGIVISEESALLLPILDLIALHKTSPIPLIVNEKCEYKKLIQVNPKDSLKFAKKIKSAFTQSYEYPEISFTTDDWINNLQKSVKKRLYFKPEEPSTDLQKIKDKFSVAKNPVFLLDYDGTLSPIVDSPDKAKPTEKLLDLLKQLTDKAKVIIATGRDKKTIHDWIPNKEIEIYAEHGTLHRKDKWEQLISLCGWKDSALEIISYYVERTPGSFVEQKETSLCFHYRNVDPLIQEKQAKSLKKELIFAFKDVNELEIKGGKKIVEIRTSGRNKGDIVDLLKNDFIFCAGDDVTDEDMFSRGKLRETFFSVLVGNRNTTAKFKVESVGDLIKLLEELLSLKK